MWASRKLPNSLLRKEKVKHHTQRRRFHIKLQLDTENKTIKLENTVKLSDLIETLEKLLPDGQWKEFDLETNTVINGWTNPVIIRERVGPTLPTYPWGVTYCGSTGKTTSLGKAGSLKAESPYTLKAGTYNVEC